MQGTYRLLERAAELKGRLLRGGDLRHKLQDTKSLFCSAHLGSPSASRDLAKRSDFSDISIN